MGKERCGKGSRVLRGGVDRGEVMDPACVMMKRGRWCDFEMLGRDCGFIILGVRGYGCALVLLVL